MNTWSHFSEKNVERLAQRFSVGKRPLMKMTGKKAQHRQIGCTRNKRLTKIRLWSVGMLAKVMLDIGLVFV